MTDADGDAGKLGWAAITMSYRLKIYNRKYVISSTKWPIRITNDHMLKWNLMNNTLMGLKNTSQKHWQPKPGEWKSWKVSLRFTWPNVQNRNVTSSYFAWSMTSDREWIPKKESHFPANNATSDLKEQSGRGSICFCVHLTLIQHPPRKKSEYRKRDGAFV